MKFEFVVTELDLPIGLDQFMATLGDYDLDCLTATGSTPADAIIDWLELHGDMLTDAQDGSA